MYAPNDIAKVTRAGFDLTDIDAHKFKDMCEIFEISIAPKHTDDGFIWTGKNGFVVTANNPITGEYYDGNRSNEIGYASYIGIEGTAEFTRSVFNYIKKNADDIKGSQFGTRGFI